MFIRAKVMPWSVVRRGIKLLEHVLKILERVIDTRVRRIVKVDDMQFGFMAGKGTTDAIHL